MLLIADWLLADITPLLLSRERANDYVVGRVQIVDRVVIFSKFTANTNRVALELGNSFGELYCHMSNGASAYGLLSNAISPNTWTHIALVYDGT